MTVTLINTDRISTVMVMRATLHGMCKNNCDYMLLEIIPQWSI